MHARTHTHAHVHTHKHFHLLCLIKCWSNKNNMSFLSPILPRLPPSHPFFYFILSSSFFFFSSYFSSLLLPPSSFPIFISSLSSQVLMIDPDTPADVIRKAYRKVVKDSAMSSRKWWLTKTVWLEGLKPFQPAFVTCSM